MNEPADGLLALRETIRGHTLAPEEAHVRALTALTGARGEDKRG